MLLAISTLVSAYYEPDHLTSFPNSEIVLDMVVLSDAVYYLRNKISSCNDPQASNPTIISLARQELLSTDDLENTNPVKQQQRRLLKNSGEPQNIFDLLLPEGITCLHYSHDYDLGTQVLIVRSSLHHYVSVVYAGTDDFTTALMDGDILMGNFGPSAANSTSSGDGFTKSKSYIDKLFEQVPAEAHVHRGFNSVVFDNDNFSSVLECVTSARLGGQCEDTRREEGTPLDTTFPVGLGRKPYQIYTSGHSLGAADSVLLGAALHLAFPKETIQSVNFGCPKIGNVEWSYWINSLRPGQIIANDGGSFEVFRFVNKIDLVPRLPELVFQHAGHTVQMSAGGVIRAYYNHWGDGNLGYAGIPFGWGEEPYIFIPGALIAHNHQHYVEYLKDYAPLLNATTKEKENMYFVREFERSDENDATESLTPGITSV
jgi:hypothetical protein